MNNSIENLETLRELINNQEISSITNDEILDWYNNLCESIEKLKKKYNMFAFMSSFRNLIILLLFILISFLISTGTFLSTIIYLFIIGGFIILHFYLGEYHEFVSNVIKKEEIRIRKELSSLLIPQINLIEELLKRNLFFNKKGMEKSLIRYQKLSIKLSKKAKPLYY